MGAFMDDNMAVIKPICQPQLYRSRTKIQNSTVTIMSSNGNNKEILERIFSRLNDMGLSATAASQKAGMSKDGIRNLSRKPNSIPRGKTLIALAEALETTPEYILTGKLFGDSNIEGLPYAGVAEAGAFRPVDMLDQDSHERIND